MTWLRKNIYVVLFFTIASLILTFPLAFKFGSAIPGFESTDEPYAVISNLWLVKYFHQRGFNPAESDFVAYPFKANLTPYVGSSYLWESLKVWLALITNHIIAFNILILLSFILSGWFTYLLAYRYLRSEAAALFSGFSYTFCAYHFARSWQHLALSQIQWMPLYLLCLFYLKEKPGLKRAILAGLVLFVLVSFNFYYAYLMSVATGTFIIFYLFQKKVTFKAKAGFLKFLGLTCLIALFLISPSLRDIFKNKDFFKNTPLEHNIMQRPFENLFPQSARPLSYFLPPTTHPLFGSFTESFLGSSIYGKSMTEHALYLGWLVIFLAAFAFKTRQKREKSASCDAIQEKEAGYFILFFTVLGIVAWLFSQPPWWDIGPIKIYMPSFFMFKILPMFRAYCRFGILLMLSAAVLSGFGVKYFTERFKTGAVKATVIILLFFVCAFEFLNFPPFKIINLNNTPQAYLWLKEQPGDFVIAQYPLDSDSPNAKYVFYQTIHHKKMINATNPGTPANNLAKTIKKLSDPATLKVLRNLGVKYAIVNGNAYTESGLLEDSEELSRIKSSAGLGPVFSADGIDIFKIKPDKGAS